MKAESGLHVAPAGRGRERAPRVLTTPSACSHRYGDADASPGTRVPGWQVQGPSRGHLTLAAAVGGVSRRASSLGRLAGASAARRPRTWVGGILHTPGRHPDVDPEWPFKKGREPRSLRALPMVDPLGLHLGSCLRTRDEGCVMSRSFI